MMSPDQRDGVKARVLIAGYSVITRAMQPVLPIILKRRLARGKEDAARWREKLAVPSAKRPQGRLIWLHAVGLGETLALRGVIAALRARMPDAHFLVTSTTRASAKVFTQNLPANTVHQLLPLDTPRHAQAFLDFWRPDLSIWAEQELWPGFVIETARRGIPLALINARITDEGFARRRRIAPLYGALLARFALTSAQDLGSADHLSALGARNVTIAGLLKSTAPPLAYDADALRALKVQLGDRFIWVAASTHPEDEAIALAAHAAVTKDDPTALLVIIPRHPERASEIAKVHDLRVSLDRDPAAQVWVIAEFGALGLWYRLARAAFIGGTNSAIEGHNPWEAAIVGCPVFHGPHYANFKADFPALHTAGGAKLVTDPAKLAASLQADDIAKRGKAARDAVLLQTDVLAALFDDLASLAR